MIKTYKDLTFGYSSLQSTIKTPISFGNKNQNASWIVFAVVVVFLGLSNFLSIAWALPASYSGLEHVNLPRTEANEATFNNAKNKGTDIVSRLSGSTDQSTWTSYSELQNQGWTVNKGPEAKSDDILQEMDVYESLCLDQGSDTLLTASHKVHTNP